MTSHGKKELRKNLHNIRNHLQIIYLLTDCYKEEETEEVLKNIQSSAEDINDILQTIESYL